MCKNGILKEGDSEIVSPCFHVLKKPSEGTVGGLEIGRLKSTNISGPQSDSALLFFSVAPYALHLNLLKRAS